MSIFVRYCQGDTKISYFLSANMAIPYHFVKGIHGFCVLFETSDSCFWAKKKPLKIFRGFLFMVHSI